MSEPALDIDVDTPGAGVVDRTTFADALTRQRLAADLSVREVARRTGQRASTLGGWFSGLHLPQRSQRPALLEVLRACGVAEADLEGWVTTLERVRAVAPPAPRPDVAPYRGLLRYEAADADWFFGRERVTALLVERVTTLARSSGPRVLTVVGASGAGKSSVLRAGLVPAVGRPGGPGGAAGWVTEVRTPADGPPAPPSATAGDDDGRPTLLVVDQLEEVFAAGVDERHRTRFLDAVFARAAATAAPTVVVLGLRADFYGTAVGDPRLARALQDEQVVLAPMGEAELRAAIVEPARRADVVVEPDLVERLLREMGVEGPGATRDTGTLPLLSHALQSTWERSSGRRMTMADYDATGGIAGSIQQTAEAVHNELDDDGRHLARQLFTRLVRVDDTTGVVTRRPLERANLPGGDAAAPVLDAFVDRRLLTTHATTVEISHERLLSAWARIGEWIEADRDALRVRHQLGDAVQAWETGGRDPAFQLTGSRLAAATELRAADPTGLSAAEQDLIAASVDAAADDRHRQRRRLRRTQRLLLLVAVLLVVASAAGVVAVRASRTADAARVRAETDGRASLSRQVAIEARQVQAQDPALAQQLAVAAWRTSPTTEARSALLDQSVTPPVTRVLGADGPTSLAVSADGRWLAVGHGDDGSVHLYALRDGLPPAPTAVVPGATGRQVFALRWLGSRLAVGTSTGAVSLYDVTGAGVPTLSAALVADGPPLGQAVEAFAVSPDGRWLAVAGQGSSPVRVWDVSASTAALVATPPGVTAGATAQTVTFSPDGTRLVAAGSAGQLFVWSTADLTGTARVITSGTTTVNTVVYDPAGRSLYSGNRAGVVEVRDAATLAVTATHQLSTTGWVDVVAFSPDGAEIAVGTSDGSLVRVAADPWSQRDVRGNPGPVTGVTYTPDGRSLVSAAADGTTRVWSAGGQVTVGAGVSVFSTTFTAAGVLAVATSGTGATARLWDVTDPSRPTPRGEGLPVAGLTGTSAITPDGALLATGAADGTVRLWDARESTTPVAIGVPFAGAEALVETLAFSPDGRTLAVGSDDNTLRLWDVTDPATPTASAVLRTGNYVLGAGFAPDGRTVAAASADGSAYLWDVSRPSSPRLRAKLGGFGSYVYGVGISPDGRLLAASGADRTTRLWDITGATPRATATLTGPKGYNIALAWRPDSRELAVASNDKTVWLYEVDRRGSGQPAATLRAVDGTVNAVAFTPDGRTLVAGGGSTVLPLWTTDPDAAAARICAAAGDGITAAEWREYVPGAAYRPPCG